jgi:hypothetical protein
MATTAGAAGAAAFVSSAERSSEQIQFFQIPPDTECADRARVAAACEAAESAFVGGELRPDRVDAFIASFMETQLTRTMDMLVPAAATQKRTAFSQLVASEVPTVARIVGDCADLCVNGARKRARYTPPAAVMPPQFWVARPVFLTARDAVPLGSGRVGVGYGLR